MAREAGPAAELVLIRHAPVVPDGRVAGRRDVAARLPSPQVIGRLYARIGAVDRIVSSPARRCVETARALWPDLVPPTDPRLREQDFGAWEGMAHDRLPDLGALPRAALAAFAPPEGESFDTLCRRVHPALTEAAAPGGRAAIVAHAGTIRAALALAIGANAPALGFEVAPLSLTRLRWLEGGQVSVIEVNGGVDES